MLKRRAAWALLAPAGALTVYLAVAMAWAAASLQDLLPAEPDLAVRVQLDAKQVDMLLRIEDPTFYTHIGIDLSDGQGLATLTSALARDVFLHGHALEGFGGVMQRFYRRVHDCCRRVDLGRDAMAVVLNSKVSKGRQLELYASRVYLGSYDGVPLHGFDAAARRVFGLPVTKLSDDQFLDLVARVKAPDFYRPELHPAEFAIRLARVKAVASGRCAPTGWFDTTYDRCPA